MEFFKAMRMNQRGLGNDRKFETKNMELFGGDSVTYESRVLVDVRVSEEEFENPALVLRVSKNGSRQQYEDYQAILNISGFVKVDNKTIGFQDEPTYAATPQRRFAVVNEDHYTLLRFCKQEDCDFIWGYLEQLDAVILDDAYQNNNLLEWEKDSIKAIRQRPSVREICSTGEPYPSSSQYLAMLKCLRPSYEAFVQWIDYEAGTSCELFREREDLRVLFAECSYFLTWVDACTLIAAARKTGKEGSCLETLDELNALFDRLMSSLIGFFQENDV